jgi:hypothetical protein
MFSKYYKIWVPQYNFGTININALKIQLAFFVGISPMFLIFMQEYTTPTKNYHNVKYTTPTQDYYNDKYYPRPPFR